MLYFIVFHLVMFMFRFVITCLGFGIESRERDMNMGSLGIVLVRSKVIVVMWILCFVICLCASRVQ